MTINRETITLKGPLGQLQLAFSKYDYQGFYAYKMTLSDQQLQVKKQNLQTIKLTELAAQNQLKKKNQNAQSKKGINLKQSSDALIPIYRDNNNLSIKEFFNDSEILRRKNNLKKNNFDVDNLNKKNTTTILNSLFSQKQKSLTVGHFLYLRIVGVGYRVFLSSKERTLVFKLGYSHFIKLQLPISVKAFLPEPTLICLYGIDKNEVTQVAATIQKMKVPSVYKGKGIRILNSYVRTKIGKKKS